MTRPGGLERGKFEAEPVAGCQGGGATKVGQPLTLFFGHVTPADFIGGGDRVVPSVAADITIAHPGHGVADIVVILDCVFSFSRRCVLSAHASTQMEKCRVEKSFFGFGVQDKERGQSAPDRGQFVTSERSICSKMANSRSCS